MRRLLALTLALAMLAVALPARAQWAEITTNAVKPADTGQAIRIGPSSAPLVIETNGEVNPTQPHTDGYVFLPAVNHCIGDTVNLIPTRIAASNWALARTGTGNETIQITCSLNNWLQRVSGLESGGRRGIKITRLQIVRQPATLTARGATWGKLATRAFANGVAVAVGNDLATAPTLTTAIGTQPYVTDVTIPTPLYIPGPAQQDLNVEWNELIGSGGIIRVYGIGVYFTRLD